MEIDFSKTTKFQNTEDLMIDVKTNSSKEKEEQEKVKTENQKIMERLEYFNKKNYKDDERDNSK